MLFGTCTDIQLELELSSTRGTPHSPRGRRLWPERRWRPVDSACINHIRGCRDKLWDGTVYRYLNSAWSGVLQANLTTQVLDNPRRRHRGIPAWLACSS